MSSFYIAKSRLNSAVLWLFLDLNCISLFLPALSSTSRLFTTAKDNPTEGFRLAGISLSGFE
jgi:hypothetical protein